LAQKRNKIETAFHTFVIEDPYPEHTQWQMNQNLRSKLDKLFGIEVGERPDPKAWRDGFEFAKALVMKELK
jgi:hypothetical protein